MSGFAVARDRYDPRIVWDVSGWPRFYLRIAALADVVRATMGALIAGRIITRPRAIMLDLLLTRFALRNWPAPPDEAAKYAGHARCRLAPKPRLTGAGWPPGNQKMSWEKSARRVLTGSPTMTASSAPRVSYSTTACLKPITALCRQTYHQLTTVPSARASVWMGGRVQDARAQS